jgi:NAD(P)-dependent dehydrogenase (short-subunit alcohol dehydrogenase family)
MGAAIARALAMQGATNAEHYSNSSSGALQVASEIREAGGRAELFQADFSQGAEACRQVFEQVVGELGPPAILVNNAAIFDEASLQSMEESLWDRTLDVNLKAPAFLCQAFANVQYDARAGANTPERRIVNLVDWRATHPCPGHLPYTVAKAGLVALTQLLAAELGPRGIRVNAVAPGAILPPPGATPAYMDQLASRTLLRRTGGPADIVHAVLYLLTATFVTGHVVHVTGGEQLSRP